MNGRQGCGAGQLIDVASGRGLPQERLLSVAEMQHALRELRAAKSRSDAREGAVRSGRPASGPHGRGRAGDDAVLSALASGEVADPDRDPGRPAEAEPGANRVMIIAACPGAGASTVALAISDAAAATGRRVHLVETADPTRSGLLSAARAELGTDSTGEWRRGARSLITLDRRAAAAAPASWPPPLSTGGEAALTVIDLGAVPAPLMGRLARGQSRTVVVCRCTLPGIRLVEQLLGQLPGPPVAVAALGAGRWPGEVRSSVGPVLAKLRAAGRVVNVPTDPGLECTGPSSAPLPKAVTAAGRALLDLINDPRPGAPRTAARTVSAMKGRTR